ncbi:hypothetical protein PFX98_05515 [Paucibacter sediminis]|uniref:Uncharacterized protein n=1 Tax=Paucibacter sediminis TaxID=3019553 RepID=A0AA95ND95_9BURK|nr:hypothetical protein [Paucibacter sp. S2-9]WIT13065.1 hypothetical protein PFX98_05515 [Paucibacter sp. S2-9]
MLDLNYQKTEAGRAEIKSRALALSRVARNLLLVLDASKTARQWLALVQGATEADFELLLQHALVAAPFGATAAIPASAAAAAAAAPAASPVLALDGSELPQLGYEELYAYLTRHAKQYLGLMKGYRVVLDVERCGNLHELQMLAQRFVEQVREAQGEDLARQVRRAMGMST